MPASISRDTSAPTHKCTCQLNSAGQTQDNLRDSGVLTSDALECEICIAMGDLSLRGDADMVPTAGADASERWGMFEYKHD